MRKIVSFLILALLFVGCSSSDKDSTGLSEADLAAQNARFGDGNIPFAEGETGLFRNIYFDYDSSAVNDRGRQDVEYNVQVLKQNPSMKLSLEGHCDVRGTKEYNMALGNRRAQAVYEMLIGYGIERSRLTTISYGAEIPLDPGFSELAHAKNRRVHFARGY